MNHRTRRPQRRGSRAAARPFRLLSVPLALLLSACSLVGGGLEDPTEREPSEGAERTWVLHGALVLEGQEMPVTLRVGAPARGSFSAYLESDFGLQGRGRGTVDGEEMDLEIDYAAACPGQMSLDGLLRSDPAVWTGEVVAEDCTGTVRGSFRFDRPSVALTPFFEAG